MHDPLTVAFRIPNFFVRKDSHGYRPSLITIWHRDPCRTKGRHVRSDDSCGWFMRAGHGDSKVLDKIVKRFEFDWDRTFKSDESHNIYFRGYFTPDGDPHLSVQGIVLNLFFIAAGVVFEIDGRSNWKKARRWMQRNLFDILLFAENPTDSLFDGITRTFEIGCGEKHTPKKREERIHSMAACIYGWILRETRPWYKHPRWHVWHWELQIHPLQTLKRWAFSRCCKCGRGFGWGYSPCSDGWGGGTGPLWFRSERGVYHANCDDPSSYNAGAVEQKA